MAKRIFAVYDINAAVHASVIAANATSFAITADEAHKTMDTVMTICRWLMNEGADRNSVMYAIGGGTTLDIAGFAASIYKRGIRYVNYPTTLLSQVDAGIGGKTAVNLDGFKNILGITRFPLKTIILPQTLKTLPERELRSGAAEMLKTFIIEDQGNYQQAVKALSGPVDLERLAPLIKAAGDIKRKIVERDPDENGVRRVLNLGHTWGHAIEWWQRDRAGTKRFTHGEAVAIGIICAARLSERLGIAEKGLADKLSEDFKSCGLPVNLPCPERELLDAISKDKKVSDGKINLVLIKKIGNVIVKQEDDLYLHSA